MHAWGRAAAIICLPSSKWFPAFTEIVIIIFKSNIDDVHAWLCNSNSAVAVWAYVPCVVLRFRGEKHGMLIEKAFSTFEVRGFFPVLVFSHVCRGFFRTSVSSENAKNHIRCVVVYISFLSINVPSNSKSHRGDMFVRVSFHRFPLLLFFSFSTTAFSF